ncbi:uncharacterized protein LOC121738737 [Aricia agestis]|uniref:uncharacterized protein LOC121738737 n=1 Tax=Aricia agestis TaxID=91739 RepID=UPI001C20BBC5|nr:uncharacterized protein LOC121738737 [Aricia agestis]
MDLRPFREITEELLLGYQRGSSYWVTVTNITTPINFYVRSTNYDNLLELLQSHFVKAIKEEHNVYPNLDDIVVYRAWGRGGKIMRGRVIQINLSELSTTCHIFALDYGYIDEDVELKDIFLCDEDIEAIPPLAIQCQLYQCGLIGDSWLEDSIEAFKFYIGGERCKMIVQNNIHNKLTVQLFNTCPEDISSMLALTGYSNLGYVDPFASRIYSKSNATKTPKIERTHKYYYNYIERTVNTTLCVRMLHYINFEEFYVAVIQEYRKDRKLLKDITGKVAKEREIREEELVVGRPVAVLVKEAEWKEVGYRGIIECVMPETHASVCLVDSGRRVLAEKTNIRSIPQSLLEHPVTIICCRTDELGIGITMSSFKQKGFKFNITIKEPGSELKVPYSVLTTRLEY